MAQKINLTIDQGSTFSAQLTLYDKLKAVFNLTGYGARGEVRKNYTSAIVVLEFTTSIPSPNDGIVVLDLIPSDTVDVKPGEYVYDVEIFKDDKVYRVVEGVVRITPEVTRSSP